MADATDSNLDETTIDNTMAAEFSAPGEYTYEGMTMIKAFPAESLDKIKVFDYRDDDIFVVTYPKAGTTWVQEIVYLLMNGGDVKEARSRDINDRFPFMEAHPPEEVPYVDSLAAEPSPRLIKSHLGPHFFEKAVTETKTKFIICMRNIKDNLVSYYHFYKKVDMLGNFQGSFGEYLKLFEQKKLVHGDWFDFNLAWWALKDNPNILFTKFEDLSQNLEGQVRRVDAFLGRNSSDDVINKVCKNVTFDVMKENPTVNRSERIKDFMRKGKVGDWRSHFSMEESVALDDLYAKKMKDSGLVFQFDIPQANDERI